MVIVPELLAQKTAALLSSALTRTVNEPGAPGLRFPRLRSGATRVSEQEARVLMCQALESAGRTYSVEYPTSETFSFTGSTPMSARTDLVVWGELGLSIAVEFKAGQPRQADVDKDMEKLAVENVRALWFHTLESTNARTLPTLFRKLSLGVAHGAERLRATNAAAADDHDLTVAVAVLHGKQIGLWLQTVTFSQGLNEDLSAWNTHTT